MSCYGLALLGVMMLSTSYLAFMFIGIEFYAMKGSFLRSFLWGLSYFVLFPTFLACLIKPMRRWSHEKRNNGELG